ncbi:MAG: hypothetical protein WC917_02715 [Bacilli bacterium]|jgi:hypothetical protein
MKKKEYNKKWNTKWRNTHREEYNEYNRNYKHKYLRKLRMEAIQHYGGKCNNCGIDDFYVLQIDHINNDGNKHRKEVKSYRLPKWLKDNGYPKEYQILCANCNWKKNLIALENKN